MPHYSSYDLVSTNTKRLEAISGQLCAERQPLGLFWPLPPRGSHPLSWRARVNAINCGFITASLYLYEDRWYQFEATGQLQETRLSFLKLTLILNEREKKRSILVAQSMCVKPPYCCLTHDLWQLLQVLLILLFKAMCLHQQFPTSWFLSASSLQAQRSF